MDVPVLSNLSLSTTKSSSVEPSSVEGSGANKRQFSGHLDDNVSRLKREQKPASVDESAVKVADETPSNEDVGVDKLGLADNVVVPETTGDVLSVIGIATNKKASDVAGASTKGGNELPLSELVDPSLLLSETGAALSDLTRPIDISFDPLTQTNESTAQMAVLAGVDQKINIASAKKPTEPLAVSLLNGNDVDLHHTDVLLSKAVEVLKPTNVAQPTQTNIAQSIDGAVNTLATQNQSVLSSSLVDKPTIPLETPVGNSRWGQDFNQRIQWMVNQSVSGAQIRLNPQHMGPVEVRIQLQNDQMNISFTAQHGATREAIDAALPRLREMLNDQNVNLVDVDVSQHSFAEQRDQQAATNDNGVGSVDSAEQEESIFDQAENEQRQRYNGLFSGFA